MSKILLTSIGTGVRKNNSFDSEYQKADYKIEDGIYKDEKLAASALHKKYQFDKIFMIGTKRSIWDAVYEEFGGSDQDIRYHLYEKKDEGNLIKEDLKVVQTQFDQCLKTEGSKCFLIDYGLNDKELWNNFSIFLRIADQIREKDRVYLDITHSFRSLLLMSYLMMDFIRSVRDLPFHVEKIFYAMFEYRNDPDNHDKTAPVVDLKPLWEISEWIKAVSAFKHYGRMDMMSSLLSKDEESKKVRNKLTLFSEAASMNSLENFYVQSKNVLKTSHLFEKAENPVIRFLSNDLQSFLKRLDQPKLSLFQLEMAKWYEENNTYALSYLTLAEALITYICEQENWDVSGYVISGGENFYFRNEAKNLIFDEKYGQSFKDFFKNVNEIRNAAAHQNEKRKDSFKNDIQNLKTYLDQAEKYLKNKQTKRKI